MASRKSSDRASSGVNPALQKRSRDKRDRLIKAGMKAFSDKGYEHTRIGDIAQEAGISVGVFYQRFKDKRAFFDALQADFVRRGRENWQSFFDEANPEWSARELLEQLVTGSARTISKNIGFFRAMLALGHHDKRAVEPVVDMDLFAAKKLEEHLVAQKITSRRRLREGQVYFGLSAVTRAIVIMSANDVGPFRATDRRSAEEFAEMLGSYLGLDLD